MNNKGFTMVELLVAMAIMGLLIIMAFPTIRAIQTNNTSTKFKEYGKSAVSASKLYSDSYAEDLYDLSIKNQFKIVPFRDLVKKDLLKDINMEDATCIDTSSVVIVRYGEDYTYCLDMKCTTKDKKVELYKEKNKIGTCRDFETVKVTYKYKDSVIREVDAIKDFDEYTLLGESDLGNYFSQKYVKLKKWKSGSKEYELRSKYGYVSSNITFEAIVEPYTYNIKFSSSISGAGTMTNKTCKVGESCVIKNGFRKDYYSFDKWQYEDDKYNNNINLQTLIDNGKIKLKKNNDTFNFNATFNKNKITVNYYSNGGSLQPGSGQRCPIQAKCEKKDSACHWTTHWTEEKGCRERTKLVKVLETNHDGTGYSTKDKGMPNYDTTDGAIYMTRSGCTGTNYWLIGSPTSTRKINEKTDFFPQMSDFANAIGKGEAFKIGDVSVDVYAEWNCPSAIKCSAGKYLPKNKTSCETCIASNYCPGGLFDKSTTKNQGLNPCPDGYKNSDAGSSKINQCYMKVSAGKYVKTAKATTQTKCSSGTFKTAHNVYYESTSKCTTCPAGYNKSPEGSTKNTDCIMEVSSNKYVKKAKDSSSTACSTGYSKGKHEVHYNSTSSCNINTCTVTFSPGKNGKFTNHSNDTKQTKNYGEFFGNDKDGMRDANKGYYSATKDWYHIAASKAWTDGTNVYNERTKHSALEICGDKLKTQSVNKTLTVNWIKNTITIQYYSNNGKLIAGRRQACPDTVGKSCKKVCTEFKSDSKGCQGRTSGFVFESVFTFDSDSMKNRGLRDFEGPNNATLYMSNGSKTPTKYWQIGKYEIFEEKPFETAKKFAKAIGKDDELKKDNVVVKASAIWE